MIILTTVVRLDHKSYLAHHEAKRILTALATFNFQHRVLTLGVVEDTDVRMDGAQVVANWFHNPIAFVHAISTYDERRFWSEFQYRLLCQF